MYIIEEGLICLHSFCAALIVPLAVLPVVDYFIAPSKLVLWTASLLLSYVIVNAIFFLTRRQFMPVAVRASFVGLEFFSGASLSLLGAQSWPFFGWYLCVLSAHQFGEYMCTAITNPKNVTTYAFLLNCNTTYTAVRVIGCIEFLVEYHFFPTFKNHLYISITGLVICVMCELLRKMAIYDLRPSFNYYIQFEKAQDHQLVSHGVFSFCRHPSYMGLYYWGLGTQMILVNPLAFVLFLCTRWSFIKRRILLEEKALLDFFGDEFVKYKKQVYSGLPFCDGIKLED